MRRSRMLQTWQRRQSIPRTATNLHELGCCLEVWEEAFARRYGSGFCSADKLSLRSQCTSGAGPVGDGGGGAGGGGGGCCGHGHKRFVT